MTSLKYFVLSSSEGQLSFCEHIRSELGWFSFLANEKAAARLRFDLFAVAFLPGVCAGCPRPNPLFWLANFPVSVARARCKLIFVAVCLPCRRLVTAGTQAAAGFFPFCIFPYAVLLLLPLRLIDGFNDSPKKLLYRSPKVKCVRCSRPLEGLRLRGAVGELPP